MPTALEQPRKTPLQALGEFLRPLTVAEYHRLLDIGVLKDGEPVELLEGVMILKHQRFEADPPSLRSIQGVRKLTVAEYHKMIEAGILKEGERVELLEGYLVKKMSHNAPHGVSVQKLLKRLFLLSVDGWEPRCQLPITLPDGEPEPDAVLARGNDSTFADHHPLPAEIGLVVEVADSSLNFDRYQKGSMYAQAGIPVYWVVNPIGRIVEVYKNPNASGELASYEKRTDFKLGERFTVELDAKAVGTILVDDLLP